jgi:uncharacterized membrane protein
LHLVTGEAKQIATGPVGTSIKTSQVRLAVNVTLLNVSIPLVLSTTVNVPIYVEMAQGTGQITGIHCQTDDMVDIHGTSGAVTATIGSVSDSALADLSSPAPIAPATIGNLKVLLASVPISASGSASVAQGSGDLVFTADDIANTAVHSIDGNGNLFQDLAGNLHLTVLGGSVPGALTSLVGTAVGALGAPLDTLLTTLGIELGVLDVDVPKAQCGVPVLVD